VRQKCRHSKDLRSRFQPRVGRIEEVGVPSSEAKVDLRYTFGPPSLNCDQP